MSFWQKKIVSFIVLISVIMVLVLVLTFDRGMFDYLFRLNAFSIFCLVLIVAVGLFFDALRVKTLASIFSFKIEFKYAVATVLGNYFLANLTPGAAGGPLAQYAMLQKAGVGSSSIFIIILARTLFAAANFALYALFALVFFPPKWLPESTGVVIVFALLSFFAVFYLLRLRFLALGRYLWLKVCNKAFFQTGIGAKLLLFFQGAYMPFVNNKTKVAKVFLLSFLNVSCLLAFVPLLFYFLSGKVDFFLVLCLSALIQLALYFAPTPGGLGVGEAAFLFLFSGFYPPSLVGIAAILWRLFTETLPFFCGMFLAVQILGVSFLRKFSYKDFAARDKKV